MSPLVGLLAVGAPVALADVLASVDRHHPTIVAGLLGVAEAEAQELAAAGAFDPVVRAGGRLDVEDGEPRGTVRLDLEQPTPLWGLGLFGGYRLGRGDFPPYEGKAKTDELGELELGLVLPLGRNRAIDRRRAGRELAALAVEVAGRALDEQRIAIRRAAAIRYFEWGAAIARRDALLRWVELAAHRQGGLADAVRAGDLPEYERLDNERTLFARRSALAAVERDLTLARIELGLFLRDAGGRPAPPALEARPAAAELPALPPAPADEAAIERRPEIARLIAERARTDLDRRWLDDQRLPAVDLAVVGAQGFETGPEMGRTRVGVGVSIDLPTWNRVADGRAEAAARALERLDAQLQLARERAAAEIGAARASVDAALARVELGRAERSVAEVLADGERTRFELGESHLLWVNLREQTAVEAELKVVDGELELARARIQLLAALAEPGFVGGARD